MVHDIFSKYKQMTENSVFKFGCTCVTQKGYALQVRPQSKTLILVRCMSISATGKLTLFFVGLVGFFSHIQHRLHY